MTYTNAFIPGRRTFDECRYIGLLGYKGGYWTHNGIDDPETRVMHVVRIVNRMAFIATDLKYWWQVEEDHVTEESVIVDGKFYGRRECDYYRFQIALSTSIKLTEGDRKYIGEWCAEAMNQQGDFTWMYP